jgi:hypothetical protein
MSNPPLLTVPYAYLQSVPIMSTNRVFPGRKIDVANFRCIYFRSHITALYSGRKKSMYSSSRIDKTVAGLNYIRSGADAKFHSNRVPKSRTTT